VSFSNAVAAAFVAAVGWAFPLAATPLYSTTVVSDPVSASATYWTGGYQNAPALAYPSGFSSDFPWGPLSFDIPNLPHSPGAWLELEFSLLSEPGLTGPWGFDVRGSFLSGVGLTDGFGIQLTTLLLNHYLCGMCAIGPYNEGGYVDVGWQPHLAMDIDAPPPYQGPYSASGVFRWRSLRQLMIHSAFLSPPPFLNHPCSCRSHCHSQRDCCCAASGRIKAVSRIQAARKGGGKDAPLSGSVGARAGEPQFSRHLGAIPELGGLPIETSRIGRISAISPSESIVILFLSAAVIFLFAAMGASGSQVTWTLVNANFNDGGVATLCVQCGPISSSPRAAHELECQQ
jgi:hypothetical protein